MAKSKKSGCYADGGVVQETPDQIMERMAKKYGLPSSGQSGATPAQAAPPIQQQQPKPAAAQGIINLLKNRGQQIDNAVSPTANLGVRYARGGIVEQVKFKGKGGPTDDQIPVKFAGANIQVSDGEKGMILPAKTANNPQAVAEIERIIEQTNGKPPVRGGIEDGGKYSLGVVDDWNDAIKRDTAAASVNNFFSPARKAMPDIPAEDAAAYAKQDNTKPVGAGAPSGIAASAQPGTNGLAAKNAFATKPNAIGAGLTVSPFSENQGNNFITGKASYDELANKTGMNAPDSSLGGFTQDGKSYNVNPAKREGISKVTATGTNPLYTNIKPEDAVTGLKNQSIGGDPQEGLARMARANSIWKDVIDKQPVGGVAINGDGGIEADNAEKAARWRQDDLISKARSNPAAGQVANTLAHNQGQSMVEAIRNQGLMRGQDVNAQSDANRNQVAMRGQDLHAQGEAARLAGNPVDNDLKRAQAGGIAAQSDSAKMISDIQRKALAGDPQAAASYRALTGKGHASDRYLTVQGGEEVGPDGFTKIKRPGGVFDSETQKFIPMNGQSQATQKPSMDQYAAHVRANNKGQSVTDQQIAEAYRKQFGA